MQKDSSKENYIFGKVAGDTEQGNLIHNIFKMVYIYRNCAYTLDGGIMLSSFAACNKQQFIKNGDHN